MATILAHALFLVTITAASLAHSLRTESDLPDCREFNAPGDQWVIPLCRFQSCMSQGGADFASCGNEPAHVHGRGGASAYWNAGIPRR